VIVARAADLFGPGATTAPLLGERFLRRVLAGRGAPAYGDPDLPHSYAYLPDLVRALVALGASPLAEGVHLLPVQPAESTAQVFGRFYEALGIPPALSLRSDWGARLRAFVRPGNEELVERLFQWKQPLVVDDARIRRELGVGITPWDVAVRETLAWARCAYGPSARPVRRRAGNGARTRGERS
jgi:nucleoside-diphosphate-sugar epimerase